MFGDAVPKGDVGGSELQAQHQLLFNTRHCTAPQIGYYAGVTRWLCATHHTPWLVVVVLESSPTATAHRNEASLANSVAIAVHRQADAVYYVDVPPLPLGWKYTWLVEKGVNDAMIEQQRDVPQQAAASREDDSTAQPCSGDIMDAVSLLIEYALSCEILVYTPSVVERSSEHYNNTNTERTTLAQIHSHNNSTLANITTIVNQRHAQLAAA